MYKERERIKSLTSLWYTWRMPQSKKPDSLFLTALVLWVLFGLVMLTSASGPLAYQKFADSYWYIKHQLLFGLVPGLTLFFVLSNIDYHRWRRYAPYLLPLCLVLLVSVFIPGLRASWGTSRSWLKLGPFSLQPIEFVKLFLLLYFAYWFERRTSKDMQSITRGLLPFLVVFGVCAGLVMAQPDLGGLVILTVIAFSIYFMAGAPLKYFAGLALVGASGMIWLIKIAPYRLARLTTFMHPELDPKGVGYQINQAFLAIGSGGFFGLGLGRSRQKFLYLPEVASDSIFAIMAEELGFFAMLIFLVLFVFFIFRLTKIAKNAPDAFGRFITVGIAAWIFFQALCNIGSMVGLLPLTGLPLPFVSYGGTSLTVLLAAMGLVTNISRQSSTLAKR